MVLGDDLRQEGVLALGQLHEGANAVNVGVDLDVQRVVFSWDGHEPDVNTRSIQDAGRLTMKLPTNRTSASLRSIKHAPD